MTDEEKRNPRAELERLQVVIKHWDTLKTDDERWLFLIHDPYCGFVLVLRSDTTDVEFDDTSQELLNDVEDFSTVASFDNCIGTSKGVQSLLDAINIPYID